MFIRSVLLVMYITISRDIYICMFSYKKRLRGYTFTKWDGGFSTLTAEAFRI
jgi:hypothetical protein